MVTAIIQARTGSKRLPNKIFSKIVGKPLIWHIVDRLKYSKRIQSVVLATTTSTNDDSIQDWCERNNVKIFRGSEDDVLDRYYQAAMANKSNIIVRITADDPFKDPHIIDSVIDLFESRSLDFAYNNSPPTFPEGLDTEVFSFDSLKKAALQSVDPFEREHVTQYFYRNPEIFKQANFPFSKDLSYLRWTIDLEPDLIMVKEIYENLYFEGKIFLMEDILNLLEKKPYLKEININVERSSMYKKGKEKNEKDF
jgi:spore coat polysaccharide biosynthesis protein SpsF